MYPVLFSIGNFEVTALMVFIPLGIIIFMVNLWKDTFENKNFAFDLILLNVFLNPIFARAFYILLNLEEYKNIGWSILPVTDSTQGLELFKTFPWILFTFWESGMNYQFIPFVLLVSLVVLNLFVKKDFSKWNFPVIWRSFIYGYLVILFGFFLSGNYISSVDDFPLLLRYRGQSVDLLPIHIIEIIVLLLVLMIYIHPMNFAKEKDRLVIRNFAFPVLWSIVQIVVWFGLKDTSTDIYVFDLGQLVWLSAAIMVLLYGVSLVRRGVTSKGSQGRDVPMVTTNRPIRRNMSEDAGTNYSYSYSNYKTKVRTQFSPRERLQQAKNKIKRGM